jgi:hypothetical protein
MSTDTRHLDEIAGKAAVAVQRQLVPELSRADKQVILCFLAPRTTEQTPWLFSTVGINGAKVALVRYHMPPDSEAFPESKKLKIGGTKYLVSAQAFVCEGNRANFDRELTERLRDMFYEAIQVELLAA